MQIIPMTILLFAVGVSTWIVWRKPSGWMSRLSSRGRFFVTLGAAVLMTVLFVTGDPQNTRITAPLMALVFGMAIALRYFQMRKKVC